MTILIHRISSDYNQIVLTDCAFLIILGWMKKSGLVVAAIATFFVAVGAICFIWLHGQPRRAAVGAVAQFAQALQSQNGAALLDSVLMPSAIQTRTPAEQTEFLVKALADEISPEGVASLKAHAEFGPAKILFPIDCLRWCQQAGVNVDDCVAFKMERAGIRAEVVLARDGATYRIVRCNNVKQMADEQKRT